MSLEVKFLTSWHSGSEMFSPVLKGQISDNFDILDLRYFHLSSGVKFLTSLTLWIWDIFTCPQVSNFWHFWHSRSEMFSPVVRVKFLTTLTFRTWDIFTCPQGSNFWHFWHSGSEKFLPVLNGHIFDIFDIPDPKCFHLSSWVKFLTFLTF